MKPLEVGVCSWSLQVKIHPRIEGLPGPPGHQRRPDRLRRPAPRRLGRGRRDADGREGGRASGMSGAMLGFPGEDYTTPQTHRADRRVRRPGPAARATRTLQVGARPDPGARPDGPDAPRRVHPGGRRPGPQAVPRHARQGQPSCAAEKGVTVAFETGQETAALLRRTLDDLKCPNLKVNFDPANMLLYDKDDPIKAVEMLAPDIRSVHVKDANRPTVPGTVGRGGPARARGRRTPASSLLTLKQVGYRGPLFIEREVGDQQQRFDDIAHGVRFIREVLG